MGYMEKCMLFRRKVLSFWKENGMPHAKAMHDWKMEFILPKIAEMDISNVLEIGTCMGVSIITVAYAIKLMGRQPRCWSIDIRDRGQNRMLQAFPEYAESVELLIYPPWEAEQFVQAHEGLTIDYLNIDGDHTRKGARYDYEHFEPMVRPGGLITFDDTSADDKFKGDENVNAYVRSLGDVHFIPNYPKPGEIGQSGPDHFAYLYKEPHHTTA